jgi:exonuclease III
LKNCKTVDNQDILPLVSPWVRSLLDDGDIEANPGPGRPSSSPHLSCLSVNVAGFKGLWSAIRLLLDGHQPDMVLIQEVFIRKSDIASVSYSVFPKGYSFFCQEGHENAQGGHRGVGVFARRNLSVRPLKKFSFADGQALAVLVEGIIIINMHTACDGCPELHQEILEWLGANAGQAPWLLVGDHNVVPHEHVLFSLLQEDGARLLAH